MAKFEVDKKTELDYERSLSSLSKKIGGIVAKHTRADGTFNLSALTAALKRYSGTLDAWAKRIIDKMIRASLAKSSASFRANGVIISKSLAASLKQPAIAKIINEKRKESLALIKSIPIEAGKRAKDLVEKAASKGLRAGYVASQIAKTEGVTKSRAMLIARTELAKTQSAIVQAQASSVGATHYRWRTTGAANVRDTHRAMNGKKVAFNKKPTLQDGTKAHAGEQWNCNCYAEPIFD